MGAESFAKNMEKGLIEVAPLAYMRGRTLDNAFIILDEAQNTTPAQMKMFLTRIGFGSKVIVTGDLSQKDLPSGAKSGLDVALHVLKKVEENLDFDYEELAKKVIEAALDYEGCPYETEINLVLTGNEEIQQTNREFRNIDRVTDVLSFPMLDFTAPADFSVAEEDDTCFHPESGELILGDIMICIPRMQEQAESYGHGQIREFAFLIAHSMLHLMGYDHMEPEEAKEMERKQEEILASLGITR